MNRAPHVLAALASLAMSAADAQVATFDAGNGLLTIPSVSVGDASYTNVRLRHAGNLVFTLETATPQVPAAPGAARFDATRNLLTVPAIKVGEATYLDVALLADPSLKFTLQSATPLAQATLDAVNAYFAGVDALWATAAPPSGGAYVASFDNCFRHDGMTRAYVASDIDKNLAEFQAREAHAVGRRTGNLQVLAVRDLPHVDGSMRREIDVMFDIVFRDGTTTFAARETLVSGNSAGVPRCSSPQVGSMLRALGNQQLVQTEVRARNVRLETRPMATPSTGSVSVVYRRSVQWQITDPMGNASYAIVTGPGPTAQVNGVVTPFSLKFISTRLLRSAPELQGKQGNYLNWKDADAWRYCFGAGTEVPVVGLADCVSYGAPAFDRSVASSTPRSSDDNTFASQGWQENGVYRFDLYNDDGWKTVNGHLGKTPLATYYVVLDVLPYKFVEMADASGTDKFPRLSYDGLTFDQVVANAKSAVPAAMRVRWTAPGQTPDGRALGLYQAWEFQLGPRVGNAGGNPMPGFRTYTYNHPGSQATSTPAWLSSPPQPEQASKTYIEHGLMYVDRNRRQIWSISSFN